MRVAWLVLALAGCVSPAKRAARIDQYVAAHPALARDELDRMRKREARAGDLLERIRLAWQGCEFELQKSLGTITVWSIEVPIGVAAIYLDGDKHEQVSESGHVLLTFDGDKLKQFTIVANGNLTSY